MLKIYSNHNKLDICYNFTIGQTFPDVQGKLSHIEINGNELMSLLKIKDIPIYSPEKSYLIWHGRHAGRIMKVLREMF